MCGTGALGEVRAIEPNAVYDAVQAGLLLHRSPRWVVAACRAGRIAASKSKGWRILGAALLDYVAGGGR